MFEQLAVLDMPQARSAAAAVGALPAAMSTVDDDALLDRVRDCQWIKAFAEPVEMRALARFAEDEIAAARTVHTGPTPPEEELDSRALGFPTVSSTVEV